MKTSLVEDVELAVFRPIPNLHLAGINHVGYRLHGHAPLDVGMLHMLLRKAKREEEVWANGSQNMGLTFCVTCSFYQKILRCLGSRLV